MTKVSIAFRAFCIAVLALAVLQIIGTQSARSAESHTPEAEVQSSSTGSMALVEELNGRRGEVEKREEVLKEREQRLSEREKEIDKKIQQMEHLRSVVSGELEDQRKNSEEKVVKMVAVFETMAPKAAAGVLESTDDFLAVDVLKRMDVKKVAKIMNIMEKTRSAKLSELLTGYYRPELAQQKDSNRKISSVTGQEEAKSQQSKSQGMKDEVKVPATTPKTAQNTLKGGENKNGEQSTRSR